MNKSRLTPATTEGPYYKPGSPERTQLWETGVPGERLKLTGHVFDTNGSAIQGARLDFWQADGTGKYDNSGFTLRGHQLTNESGEYALDTVVPAAYTGRTAHIHVKVGSPDGRSTLTAQLFMPGLASNGTDSIFREELVMKVSETPKGKTATFDFFIDRD